MIKISLILTQITIESGLFNHQTHSEVTSDEN